jgi:hypothetical protein
MSTTAEIQPETVEPARKTIRLRNFLVVLAIFVTPCPGPLSPSP